MAQELTIALTADLHWGSHRRGDEATHLLRAYLRAEPPDLLVLAGDLGAAHRFAECLQLFEDLPCQKAVVPGNHDIWVESNDARGDSLQVYETHLPRLCAEHGAHYLDAAPLVFPDADLALVGSINWYDYSWSLEQLQQELPDWETRLRTKRLERGQLNDYRYVRWQLNDVTFTARVIAKLRSQCEAALAQVSQAVLITHFPTFYALCYPRPEPITTEGRLWDAFSGNTQIEEMLSSFSGRLPFAFCGHTHRAREGQFAGVTGRNIGGDYHFKRLLLLRWPVGEITAHTFGEP